MSKEEADDLKKIQTWFLKKHGYFRGGYISGTIKWTNGWTGNESSVGVATNIFQQESYLRIWYTQTNFDGEKTDFDYKIPLVTIPCYFGGVRYWFQCPWYSNGVYCGRRVGVLYLGGKYFACRQCYDLSYESKNENRRFRDYPIFAVLSGYKKIEEMEAKIKRRSYAGKATRKQRALERICSRFLPYLEFIRKNDLLTKK